MVRVLAVSVTVLFLVNAFPATSVRADASPTGLKSVVSQSDQSPPLSAVAESDAFEPGPSSAPGLELRGTAYENATVVEGTVNSLVSQGSNDLVPIALNYTFSRIERWIEVDLSNARSASTIGVPKSFVSDRLAYPALISSLSRRTESANGTVFHPDLTSNRWETVDIPGRGEFLVITNNTDRLKLVFQDFRPTFEHASFSRGSLASIGLERPMQIQLLSFRIPEATGRFEFTIEFTDVNRAGQIVSFSKEWLASWGIRGPTFWHGGKALSAFENATHFFVQPSHFSPIVITDNFEASGWTSDASGGSTFKSTFAQYGYVSDRYVSASRSLRAGFTGGNPDGQDYGTAYNRKTFSVARVDLVSFWFYVSVYGHTTGDIWDSLRAGMRIQPKDSAGTVYATYTYLLAAWTKYEDTATVDSTTKLIHAIPLTGVWVRFDAFPNGDWSIDWSRASTVQVELFASAAGTYADSFQIYFDDFVIGQQMSLVQYVFKNSRYESEVRTMCPSYRFTVPSTTKYVYASLWMADNAVDGSVVDYDFSLWDAAGKRTGGWTSTESSNRFDVPNSQYSGFSAKPEWITVQPVASTSAGIWTAGCYQFAGSGVYYLTVSLYIDEWVTSGTLSHESIIDVTGAVYRFDVELQMPKANDFDLSLWTPTGVRTGGCVPGDCVQRTNALYTTYSGWLTQPEWIWVDPPGAKGLWNTKFYAYSGNGNYLMRITLLADRSFWSVHMHIYDAGGDETNTKKAFDEIRRAGATRTRAGDFVWQRIEPGSTGGWSWRDIRYHMKYVSWAYSRGLDVIAIVNFDKGGSDWVWTLYGSNKPTFFTRWNQYCQFIGQQFGRWIYYYQMSNEENHRILTTVDRADEPTLFTQCASGLFSGEGTSGANHVRYLRTIVNALVDGDFPALLNCGWDCDIRYWLDNARSAIDIPSLDHYPGTWSSEVLGCGNHYADLDLLHQIAIDYQKRPAISETGYSSYTFLGHDENNQRDWTNCALPDIRNRVSLFNGQNSQFRYEFGSWYELIDANTNGGGDIEFHFGILHTDMTRKPAYAAFQSQVGQYGF